MPKLNVVPKGTLKARQQAKNPPTKKAVDKKAVDKKNEDKNNTGRRNRARDLYESVLKNHLDKDNTGRNLKKLQKSKVKLALDLDEFETSTQFSRQNREIGKKRLVNAIANLFKEVPNPTDKQIMLYLASFFDEDEGEYRIGSDFKDIRTEKQKKSYLKK